MLRPVRQLSIRCGLSRSFVMLGRKMLINEGKTYEDAINTLNSLQTNYQYIQNAVIKPKADTNIAEVTKFLKRTGVDLEKLDKLSIIHVTGTNGKGSTCSYCENILRNHGYKTGFYSSPHLLDVRERIRVNGRPISKSEFASQFWKIYNLLDKKKENPSDMPLYFRYLTLLAFHVFLERKVDVAILEVGIGGEYDCTNVVRKTAVVGITPLDLDHTSLLGNSLESIAWNKSGIMKEGCVAFTVNQPSAVMRVFNERRRERECDLKVVQDNYYKPESITNIPSHIQRTNASLALAISEAYINKESVRSKNRTAFSMELAKKSIEEASWPGRYEIKQFNQIRFFLDGAHTLDSTTVCTNWFREKTTGCDRRKALIFNLTGDRKVDSFFKELRKCVFNTVIFIPNVGSDKDLADNTDFVLTTSKQLQRCNQYKTDWLKMEENVDVKADEVLVFSSFAEALRFLNDDEGRDVLVTGSIHLIGAALSVLDPTLGGLLND